MDWERLNARRPEGCTAFRWLDGQADGCAGLVVEIFSHIAVFQVFHPQCRMTEAQLTEVAEACARHQGIEAVYRKDLGVDRSFRPASQDMRTARPWWGKEQATPIRASEYGVDFWVWPHEGYHVGWFLDQRENRRQVRLDHPGGALLNLFCYTAAFSLGPARDGEPTTNVDLSRRTLDKARQNFAVNGVVLERHRFVAEDAVTFVRRAARRNERYGTVVVDPPTFARKGKQVFRVLRDLPPLAAACFALLEPGGQLWVSSNSHQWTPERFRRSLQKEIPDGRFLAPPPPPPDCRGGWELNVCRIKKS